MKRDENHPVNLTPYNDLKRRVEITKDARFQAKLRLDNRQKASYFAISLLSLFVIVLSLIPNIFDISDREGQALLALTVVNSVFVIITTFLEASGNHTLKGERLHQCAREVSNVFNKMMLLDDRSKSSKEIIEELQVAYQKALNDCPFNHDNIDYDLVKMNKPHLFSREPDYNFFGIIGKNISKFAHYIREHFWLAPHMVVVVTSIIVVYYIVVV